MSTVRITNADKFYNRGKSNELHVMDRVNLELPESGMVAIFGQSGCGKTTLLNAVGGLDKIASGSIELFGQNIREDTDTLRNKYIGYIFQNYNLNVADTVYENVSAALRLCGMDDEDEIAERTMIALANVGMDKYSGRTPDTLSGGQQQRVAIARALVKNPAIILADEPTGNLDETNTVLVMDILKEISRTHLVLLVTHEENLVEYYCDRIIEIVDGRIHSDRENSGANGYVQRNKNDIFLGELTRTETETPGVTVEYYGEPMTALRLQIVHIGGKLYLKANDPTVKILDESSEIKLREGIFNATPAPEHKNDQAHLDMSRLTPVEGKHFGRLYHWKNALVAGWRENFSKKQKKSRRRLRVCLVMLAIVMVFMTAVFGAGIHSYVDATNEHNANLFYIPLDPAVDYSDLMDTVNRQASGIDYTRLVGSHPQYSREYVSFSTAAFMTATPISLSVETFMQDITHAADLTVVAGTSETEQSADILITTALADKLLEASTVSYIDTYDDLVGLVSEENWRGPGNYLRIVGVVESDEYFCYMDGIALTRQLLWSYYGSPAFEAASFSIFDEKPAQGSIVYVNQGYNEVLHKVGDQIKVMGKTFTVSEIITLTDEDRYDENGYPTKYDSARYSYIMADEDYVTLSNTVGLTENCEFYGYHCYDFGNGDGYHSNHLMIRSNDPAATEDYLTAAFGESGYLSPDDILQENLAETRTVAIIAAVSVLVVLALMCLCVFFIMRSSFMNRVREVGILRAIGVTRRNLIFRFGVETGVLITLTLVIAYLLSSWFIASLSDAALFSTLFYFPLWLGGGLLVVICAAAMLFGILPAMLLLRRTPSEILSKYDI